MRKIASLCTVLMLLSALTFGQTRVVTGQIIDEKGSPIAFATILETGTQNATKADADGKFSITVKDGATLAITSTGFDPITITPGIGFQTYSLKSHATQLQEVVVTTALGIVRQKKDLGYAAAKVTGEELTKAKSVNVANGLQGKVSGLNVTTVNNGVFEEVKINLRGIRSLLGSNNPMLLLDGVPVPLGYMSSLNPNDIENINVLKGTSAAAIYGPDAVNGVIVISTKRGAKSGAPEITVGHSTQLSRISFFPAMQYEFGSGGYGVYTPYENWSWGPAFDGSEVEIGRQLPDGTTQMVPFTALVKEKKKFFNTGITIQNDVSLSAKDFYISVQDAIIKGIVPDDKNRRTGIRLNASREYGKFKVTFNTNYIQSNYNVFDDDAMGAWNAANNVGLNDGLMNLIFNTPGQIPLTSYKDFINNKYATYNNYFNDYGLNPYFAMDNWRQRGKNDDLISNIDLSLRATNWLSLTYRAAVTVNTVVASTTSKGEIPNAYGVGRSFPPIPGAVAEQSSRASRLSSEIFASFNQRFGDFRINAIAGQYFRQADARVTTVSAGNLVVPELFNVANRTGELGGGSTMSKTRLLSFYGSVGVNFKGWVNVEVTGRNDQTSLLAAEKRSFFYPGVSASLVLSDAISSLKGNKTLSFLKLRGSWNKTGNVNAIGAYGLSATFSQASGFPYGSLPGFTANNTSPDPLLEPEFVKAYEAGIEMAFLKNRITVEATYFSQDNTDQIIPIAVSDATGFTRATVNAASFTNKGVEFDLRLTPLVRLGRTVDIDFKGNATYNTSEVTSVYQGLDEIFAGGFDNFAANYVVKGSPAYIFKATDWQRDGQGRVIVSPTTGHPLVDPSPKRFGRTMPLWIVGLNPSVTWKSLSFSVLGEYRGGHYAYHNIGPDMAWTGISRATATNHREHFVFPNSVIEDPANPGKYIPNTDIAIGNINDFYTGEFRDVATNFLTSAASWRLREASISYDIPGKTFGKAKFIKGATVAVTARNLFLWVPSTNEFSDPDFNFTTTNTSGVGISQINPPVRTFGASVNIRF